MFIKDTNEMDEICSHKVWMEKNKYVLGIVD